MRRRVLGLGMAAFVVDQEEITIPVEVRSAKMVAAQFLVDADAANV